MNCSWNCRLKWHSKLVQSSAASWKKQAEIVSFRRLFWRRKCSRKFCFRATLWKHKTSTSIPTILPVAQTWGSYGDAAAILVWRPDSSREWIGGEGYCSKALTNRVGLSSWSSNSNLILFSCDRSTSPDFFPVIFGVRYPLNVFALLRKSGPWIPCHVGGTARSAVSEGLVSDQIHGDRW